MYEVFARTKSVCPVCLRTIDAEKAVAGDGFVHLIKTCPEHGFFDTLIWGAARTSTSPGAEPAPVTRQTTAAQTTAASARGIKARAAASCSS